MTMGMNKPHRSFLGSSVHPSARPLVACRRGVRRMGRDHRRWCLFSMTECKPTWSGPLTIVLERREDGGLHVYSNELPGLILSSAQPAKLMADVIPAINALIERGAARLSPATPEPQEEKR